MGKIVRNNKDLGEAIRFASKNKGLRQIDVAQKAGLREQDMDSIFAELVERTDVAIAETTALATSAGTPESTHTPIFAGVIKRAGMIQNLR